ncbi:MAG: PKD domain-containing protein [Saprospiraceae bacterium]|nr:PKD domain-containing protein [Saprospiraceae bacterium]
MNRFLLLLICLLPTSFFAQTSIGGQINEYASVLAVVPCSASLTLNDASAFATGQQVLLIQMQGSTITEGDNASFGTINEMNGAGQYELARIASVSGNIVTLENELLHDYGTGGKVQLISVPEYTSAVVESTLTAQAWNGQTGGVLALHVTDTLWLQADIDASGTGFRGGVIQNPESSCVWFLGEDNYYYNTGNWRGAWKGEGCAAYISGKELGRGAQANGGGGGNDHNSGGGGGGHFTAGGQGGLQTPPTNFGCSGNYPGVGGKAIPGNPGVFLGGGGGAGHTDDLGAGSPGGRGGGIILLDAATVIGNDFQIVSDGVMPDLAVGDGAGGGGAGGSILFLVNEWVGPLTLSVKGGDGGFTHNILDRCYGPGGGGSGGRILSNQATPPTMYLNGGVPGENANVSSNCPDVQNGAQSGSTGLFGSIDQLPASTDTIVQLSVIDFPATWFVCAGQTGLLVLEFIGAEADFQWQANAGAGYVNLSDGADYTGVHTDSLYILNPQINQAGTIYRCVLNSACYGVVFSTDIELVVESLPEANFDLLQNGNEIELNASATNADDFQWDFGDNSMASGAMQVHTYNEIGIYIVELLVSNACGSISLFDTVQVGSAPEANFNFDFPGGCVPLTVNFMDLSGNDPDSWSWTFPGGVPATSQEQNPVVVYTSPGLYDVSLEASNAVGSSTFTIAQAIEALEPPQADFIYQINGDTVAFANTSTGDISSFQWAFGEDPMLSNEENPVYVFPGPGIYEVTFSISNTYCGSFVTYTIEIINTGIESLAQCRSNIWPVPASDFLTVNACMQIEGYRLIDLSGQVRESTVLDGSANLIRLDLKGLPSGMYFLELLTANGREYLALPIQRR